ncbi:MAG: S24 family peptidase [Bryobacteraceae bacterium]
MESTATVTTQVGQYSVVQVALPGTSPVNAGILLLDPVKNRLYLRFRRDWDEIADEEDAEVLQALAADLESKAQEMGASELLDWMEEHLSNVIRISGREQVLVDSFEPSAARLYRQHVSPKVLSFRTHLPKYSLRAAAGRFGEQMEVEPEDWEECPANLKLTADMFIAHVVGHSMEPRIPDGSLCVFRYNVVGSRNGKLLLVMHYGETGENRFTIKRYRSVKVQSEEGWKHEKITLEPLNLDYPSWELEENSPIKVIGEFITVLAV